KASAAPRASGLRRTWGSGEPPRASSGGGCAPSVTAAIGARDREGEGTTMKTYADMTAELAQLAAHHDRLTAGQRSPRAPIAELKHDLERVGDPPNSSATFRRRCEGTTIDVLHHGRRLRVATSAPLDLEALAPGAELRLNEALAAVEAVAPSDAGNV